MIVRNGKKIFFKYKKQYLKNNNMQNCKRENFITLVKMIVIFVKIVTKQHISIQVT